MTIEFGKQIQMISEKTGTEVSPDKIYNTFLNYYHHETPLKLKEFQLNRGTEEVFCEVIFYFDSKTHKVQGKGSGAIDSFIHSRI